MQKNKVIYTIKDGQYLVEKIRIFENVSAACNFFNSIKSLSVTKPIIETVGNQTNGK
jgi:hypothetical protein